MQAAPTCTPILARSKDRFGRWLVAGLLTTICAASNSLAGDHHTLRFVSSYGYPQDIKCLVFSPDGSELAASTSGDQVSLIRTANGEITGHIKQLTPFSMNYSRDGSRMFMISSYGSRLLDVRRHAEISYQDKQEPGFIGIRLEKRNGKLLFAQIQEGGPVAALGEVEVGDELVEVGQSKSGRMQNLIGSSPESAVELFKGPAGTHVRLSVIKKGRPNKRTFTVRRLPKRIRGGKLIFSDFLVESMQDNLVWCVRDRRHTFISAATGKTLASIETEEIETTGQYSISPDATQFAVLAERREGDDYAIELFDIATQQRSKIIDFPGDTWSQIAFSSDASHLYIAMNGRVEVLNLATEEYLQPMPFGGYGGNRRSIDRLAVSSTGILAIATRGALELWNLHNRKKIASLAYYASDDVSELCFSPDGNYLAFFSDDEGVLHIFDIAEYSKTQSPEPTAELLGKLP